MGKKSRRQRGGPPSNAGSAMASGLRRQMQETNDRSQAEAMAMMHDLDSKPLPVQRAIIRESLTKLGTDCAANDADPTGDGDQTPIRTESGRQAARDIYAIGGDIGAHLEQGALSPFAFLCVVGESVGVEKMLKEVSEDRTALRKLLETRETSMRLSPLLLTVAGGKNVRVGDKKQNHIDVIRVLLRYGACPDAKDVLGKSVCHYGAGAMATKMTLDATDICIRAARTAYLFGTDIELFGLENGDLNGAKGIVGGFLAENDRRVVYLVEQKKEVAVNPDNIRLLSLTADPQEVPMLADVQDRMGSVPLHEVAMVDRVDVAEFLLKRHHAKVDVTDMDEVSPLSMSSGPGQMASRVCAMILEAARNRGAKERKAEKLHCSYCRATPAELHECGGCKINRYCNRECQRLHWRAGHKEECSLLTTGVKLDPPLDSGRYSATISLATGKSTMDGSYRKPDGVDTEEKFTIKVQAVRGNDRFPISIYDESRQCSFSVSFGQPGYSELLEATRAEKAFAGQKCYIKASFDASGTCTVYPKTSKMKKKYTW